MSLKIFLLQLMRYKKGVNLFVSSRFVLSQSCCLNQVDTDWLSEVSNENDISAAANYHKNRKKKTKTQDTFIRYNGCQFLVIIIICKP